MNYGFVVFFCPGRYAGFLLGITNTFGTIPGVMAPIVTGYFTEDVSPESQLFSCLTETEAVEAWGSSFRAPLSWLWRSFGPLLLFSYKHGACFCSVRLVSSCNVSSPSLLCPQHSLDGWRKVFWVAAGINVGGALFYTLLGSGKVQPWADVEEERAEPARTRTGTGTRTVVL